MQTFRPEKPIIMPTRRHTLLGALLAVPSLSTFFRAEAAMPSIALQAPGFYRHTLGDFQITIINDGINRRPNLDNFIANADAGAIRQALEEAFLPTTHLDITFNITVLNTGRQTVMFDAGTGGLLAPTAGTMWNNMQAAGITPAAIDAIVFTHFHGDHISGLVDRQGQPRFPKAELIVPETEWDFWMGPHAPAQSADMVKTRFAPYRDRIRRVASTAEALPGVTGIPTFGHTPGHTSWRIASGSDSILVLGDVTNHPALNLAHPGWHLNFDMDPVAAEAARRRILDQAAADRTTVIGYHWPFPALGHVRKTSDGYAMVPLLWTTAL